MWRLWIALVLMVGSAHADERYPRRPVQIIVPFTTGDAVDVVARGFARAMARQLDARFTVVNRDGAGGTIGSALLAASRADGYTLGFGASAPITTAPHLIRSLAYSLEDFDFVCQVFEAVVVLAVGIGSGARSVADLIAAARADPGKIAFGHAGVASIGHLAVEAFAAGAGVRFMPVAYRADAQMLPQLLLGRLEFGVPAAGLAAAYRELRVLAVANERRSALLPEVPTLAELRLAAVPAGANGLFAPRGTPATVLGALERACEWATRDAEMQTLATRAGLALAYLERPAFARRVLAEHEANGALIRRLELMPQ